MTYDINEARRLRAIIESQMQTAPDATAVEAVTLYPHWKPDTAYEVGYRVQYNGILYSVLQTHTSEETWTPDITAALYAKVLIPDSNIIPEWEQPESTNPYMTGDRVRHEGKVWQSEMDNNVWTPGEYGWTEITE